MVPSRTAGSSKRDESETKRRRIVRCRNAIRRERRAARDLARSLWTARSASDLEDVSRAMEQLFAQMEKTGQKYDELRLFFGKPPEGQEFEPHASRASDVLRAFRDARDLHVRRVAQDEAIRALKARVKAAARKARSTREQTARTLELVGALLEASRHREQRIGELFTEFDIQKGALRKLPEYEKMHAQDPPAISSADLEDYRARAAKATADLAAALERFAAAEEAWAFAEGSMAYGSDWSLKGEMRKALPAVQKELDELKKAAWMRSRRLVECRRAHRELAAFLSALTRFKHDPTYRPAGAGRAEFDRKSPPP